MTTSTCPSSQQLHCYVLGQVPQTEEEQLQRHLQACPTCLASLAALRGRDKLLDAVRAGADAAVPALPVTETIKRMEDDVVVETLDRHHLVVVQTPQAFRAEKLRAAHAEGSEATDDAALVEAAGSRVVIVSGEGRNLKITEPADLAVAALWLEGCP